MENVNKTSILFDLDGTLIDSLPDIGGTLNLLRVRHGLPILPISGIRVFIGKGVEFLIEGCFKELGPSAVSPLVEEYRTLYADNPHMGGALFPGVLETLTKLRRNPNVLLGIVTNKPSYVVGKTLDVYLPGFHFDEIAGPEDVTEKKPSPLHILEVLDRIGGSPENTWYIGDDPVDFECAQAAKVRFLGATYGIGNVEVPEAMRLRCFAELLEKIKLP